MKQETYDVAVLGSGIGGSALAAGDVAAGLFGMLSQLPLPAPPPIRRMFDFDPSVLGGPAPQMPESAAVPAMA